MNKTYIFFYGTLQPGGNLSFFEKNNLSKKLIFVGNGYTNGTLLHLENIKLSIEYPGLIENETRSKIFGTLFEVKDSNVFTLLDIHEDYNPQLTPEVSLLKNFYIRKEIPIHCDNTKTYSANCYFLNTHSEKYNSDTIKTHSTVVSGNWLEYISARKEVMPREKISELMLGLFSSSEIMILDLKKIPKDLQDYKNIKLFFDECKKYNIDPKLPENRQHFNNYFLEKSNKKYLIGGYLEERIEMLRGSKIAEEGRTLHLGIDIFCTNLENLYAPCDLEVVRTVQEKEDHSFGYYIILKPDPEITNNYIFIGHLSKVLPNLGKIKQGEIIGAVGDYVNNENGGWSRHLHIQLLKNLHENNVVPIGYSTKENLNENSEKFPDPSF